MVADDRPAEDAKRAEFITRLNARLPRTRVIAQGLALDGTGRVLVCELTYKLEWDLPGGVVDPGESPAAALSREVHEELGVAVPVGRLLAVDWLPPYRQWDDALLCLFDLGDQPRLAQTDDLELREIVALHRLAPDELDQHLAPYAVRLVRAGLEVRRSGAGTVYLEDGYRPAT